MICKFVGNFLFKSELICLLTSMAIVSAQLNGFNYCNLKLIFHVNINNVIADSEVIISITI